MEFALWNNLMKEFLPSFCYKFARDIRACIKAVDVKLKPSYLFDLAFISSEIIIAWLKRLHDVHLVQCRLSVIAIDQQMFIVNRDTIKHRMNEITCGNEQVMLVDVSSDLKEPHSTSTTLYQIVQYTAKVVQTNAVADLPYIIE